MSVQSDIGPNGPSRGQVFAQAIELRALAQLAATLSVKGPGQDVPRALAQFDRMRAILGDGGN